MRPGDTACLIDRDGHVTRCLVAEVQGVHDLRHGVLPVLEHQLLQTFGIKVQQGTAYDILVKGYVREANTGIAIYVDKRFTNAANPIYKAKPEPVGEFPADSLGN